MSVGPGLNPPMGGADLECLLLCSDVRVSILPALIAICQKHGFRLVETDALLAYRTDPIEPSQVSQALQLGKFVAEAESSNARGCIANLYGELLGTRTPFGLFLDLKNKVVVVSMPEDVLWDFGDDAGRADFAKLRAFGECCKEIASWLSPVLGYLGTEVLHPQDMISGTAEDYGASRVDETFFSERRLREIFDWYMDEYVRRWE